ncbi:hypothetical protein FHS21_005914 [Phyllobacterium trifolii]|uniref:Uncharacterized protein n=1 Tax=Phyllobacterium trifolii TaxID=300193 RepID=A0A839ULH3_9HYPH|nr:hypothetical protein [Phyllobacterium trifolii]MBB3149461.1 hypothetical protein [Phyllobacterium trifolii]
MNTTRRDIEKKMNALHSAYDDVTQVEEGAVRRCLNSGGFSVFRGEYLIIPKPDTWLPSGVD